MWYRLCWRNFCIRCNRICRSYLFECEDTWIEVLEATFALWSDKVTIVHKYVNDVDDEQNVTLDTYFKDKFLGAIYLKMDIEGCERKALRVAKKLLNSSHIFGAVCVYHLQDDELLSVIFWVNQIWV